jgi:hypothetical protein
VVVDGINLITLLRVSTGETKVLLSGYPLLGTTYLSHDPPTIVRVAPCVDVWRDDPARLAEVYAEVPDRERLGLGQVELRQSQNRFHRKVSLVVVC